MPRIAVFPALVLISAVAPTQSTGTLAKQLADKSASVRVRALRSVAKLGKRAASLVPAVVARLADENVEVAAAACEACDRLGAIARDPARAAVAKHRGIGRIFAAAACARLEVELDDSTRKLVGEDLPQALRHASPAMRREAIRAARLARAVTDDAHLAILHALVDEDREVKRLAVTAVTALSSYALPKIKALIESAKVEASPGLVRALRERVDAIPMLAGFAKAGTVETRVAALTALGGKTWRARSVLPQLVACCKDGDPAVRAAAIVATSAVTPDQEAFLATVGDALSDDHPTVLGAAHLVVTATGLVLPSFLPKIIGHLSVADARRTAVDALAGCEARLVAPAIATRLASKDLGERAAAAEALARLGAVTDATVQAALQLAKHKDRRVRAHAIAALGKLSAKASRGVPILRSRLKNKDDVRVACAALGALGMRAKKAVSDLGRLLANKDKSVARAAAAALGNILDKKGVSKLVRYLEDPAIGVAVAKALGEMGSRSKTSLKKLLAQLRDRKAPHRAWIAWLIGQLNTSVEWDEALIARNKGIGLIRSEAQKAFTALAAAALDRTEDRGVRKAAIRAMLEVHERAARKDEMFAALIKLARDRDVAVSALATEKLDEFKGRDGVTQIVEEHLSAEAKPLRVAALTAANALRMQLTQKSLEAVRKGLADPDPEVHRIAGELLAQSQALRADLIAELSNPNAIVRRAAVFGLADHAEKLPLNLVPGLLELAKERDSEMRSTISSILGSMKGVLPKLTTAAGSDDVVERRTVAAALALIGFPAKELLQKLAGDTDELVRMRAEGGLAGLR